MFKVKCRTAQPSWTVPGRTKYNPVENHFAVSPTRQRHSKFVSTPRQIVSLVLIAYQISSHQVLVSISRHCLSSRLLTTLLDLKLVRSNSSRLRGLSQATILACLSPGFRLSAGLTYLAGAVQLIPADFRGSVGPLQKKSRGKEFNDDHGRLFCLVHHEPSLLLSSLPLSFPDCISVICISLLCKFRTEKYFASLCLTDFGTWSTSALVCTGLRGNTRKRHHTHASLTDEQQ